MVIHYHFYSDKMTFNGMKENVTNVLKYTLYQPRLSSIPMLYQSNSKVNINLNNNCTIKYQISINEYNVAFSYR